MSEHQNRDFQDWSNVLYFFKRKVHNIKNIHTGILLLQTACCKNDGYLIVTSLCCNAGMLAAESDKGTNIQNLVGHAGGVVETQLPESVSGKDAKLSTQWLLIADEKDIKREQKWSKGKVASNMPFHGRTMLIDSIMQQTLDRKHGMLFTT